METGTVFQIMLWDVWLQIKYEYLQWRSSASNSGISIHTSLKNRSRLALCAEVIWESTADSSPGLAAPTQALAGILHCAVSAWWNSTQASGLYTLQVLSSVTLATAMQAVCHVSTVGPSLTSGAKHPASPQATWKLHIETSKEEILAKKFQALNLKKSLDLRSRYWTKKTQTAWWRTGWNLRESWTFPLNVAIFWDIAPCSPYVNRRFGGTYDLHLQGRGTAEQETSA
jgi:hypothetical protein